MPAVEVTGAAFPFRIDQASGRVATTGGTEKVMQNVRILLATRTGERVMEREYGTLLPGLVHEANDDALADLAAHQARQAVLRWERRVIPADIQVAQRPDEGRMDLRLVLAHPDLRPAGELAVPVV